MGMIWYGQEEIEFTRWTNITVETTASYRRAFPRCTLAPEGNGYAYRLLPGGPYQALWLGCRRYRPSGTLSGTNLLRTLALLVDNEKERIAFKEARAQAPVAIQLVKVANDGTETVLATSEGLLLLTGASLDKWDVCIETFGTDLCRVRLFVGWSTFIDYTGPLHEVGDIGITGFLIRNATDQNTAYVRYSEIMVADEDTRPLGLGALALNAAGDLNQWSGGTFTQVNGTVLDVSTVLYSATPNADFLANVNDTPAPVGGYVVKSVKTVIRHTRGVDSPVTNLQHLIKTGGTINPGPSEPIDVLWGSSERFMHVNPVTGLPWTAAEITALQVGMRAIT